MTHTVSRVAPDDLLEVWMHLAPQIRSGLKKGAGDTLTEKWLYEGVMSGALDLWVVHKGQDILAGLFLLIENREPGKALVVLNTVAGSGHGFREFAEDMLPRLREYGQMIGAYTVESYSRPGAARILTRLGCKPKAVIMELR
jgi:hypothetical protein